MENIQQQTEIGRADEKEGKLSCPQNQTSREQWIDYLDGALAKRDAARLDLHLAVCPGCRTLRDRLVQARKALLDSARQIDIQTEVNEPAISRIWDGLRFRIRRALTLAEPAEPSIGLAQLRSILVSICGSAAADDALKIAGLHADRRQPEPFPSGLTSMVETISGDRAARLVERAARLVVESRVA
jgi:predicted anti-sigma-YlaC factor YlaD